VVGEAEHGHRLTELLRSNTDVLVARWVEAVATSLRGRTTSAELERDFRELFASLLPVASGDGRDLAGHSHA
jgi:rsbT co-antagonist protein RsbR